MAYVQGRSGSFTVTTTNIYIKGTVTWNETYDIASNTSYVSATLRLSRTNSGYTTEGSGSFTLYICGQAFTESGYYVVTENSNTYCVSGGAYIPHNSDGTMAITIEAHGNVYTAYIREDSSSYYSGSFSLTTIPRGSLISSVTPTVNIDYSSGSKCEVNILRYSSSFYHTVRYFLDSTHDYTQRGVTTYTSFVIPDSWRGGILAGDSKDCEVTLTTYSDSGCTNAIGDAVKTTFKLVLPANVKPVISNFTVTPFNDNADVTTWGINLKGYTKAAIAVTVTPADYTSIKTYEAFINDKSVSLTDNKVLLNSVDDNKIVYRVTDSRGRSTYAEYTMAAVDYYKPVITIGKCNRCDSTGKDSKTGTGVCVNITANIAPCNNKNAIEKAKVYWYEKSGTKSDSSSYDITNKIGQNVAIVAGLAADKTYYVEVVLYDNVNKSTSSNPQPSTAKASIPMADITLHLAKGGKGVGIGKYATANNQFAVAWDTQMDGALSVNGAVSGGSLSIGGSASVNSLNVGGKAFQDKCKELLGTQVEFVSSQSLSGTQKWIKYDNGEFRFYGSCTVSVPSANWVTLGGGYEYNSLALCTLPFTPVSVDSWIITPGYTGADVSIVGSRYETGSRILYCYLNALYHPVNISSGTFYVDLKGKWK